MGKQFPKGTHFDSISEFSGGISSSLNPLLLKNNQLSFGRNLTVRDAYLTHRPPYRIMTLDFGGNAALQTVAQGGLFQGACFYRPDAGSPSLRAAISGRLYQFTINNAVAAVADITGAFPQSPTALQHWIWQSEIWTIWNDGSNLPVFTDTATSRRSQGPSVLLGTTSAPFTPPAIGSTVTLTLTDPYTGAFNIPVIINGAFYQTVASTGPVATYTVKLTHINPNVPSTESNFPGTSPSPIVQGSNVFLEPAKIGYVLNSADLTGPVAKAGVLSLTTVQGVSVGDKILVFAFEINGTQPFCNPTPHLMTVTSVDATLKQIGVTAQTQCNGQIIHVPSCTSDGAFSGSLPGLVTHSASTAPNVLVGATVADFTNPSVGAPVTINLTQPYTGADDQVAWIGDDQYLISAVGGGGGTTSLTVINLTDTTIIPVPNPAKILSVPELPAGRMGAYGMGRNWESLIDGISYVGGDIVGGSSGTPAFSNRDAVLRTVENTFQLGGGNFRIPVSGQQIRAMCFSTVLDTSLGQGPLQVYTDESVFSVNTPTDRAVWVAVTNPLQTQNLIGRGALAQNSTFSVNNDTFFRAIDGESSLVMGRRDFQTLWSNTPISQEMDRVFQFDNQALLPFSSGVVFNNRALFTARPQQGTRGVYSTGLVALNFDPLSVLSDKLPPVYDGLWEDLNVLQILAGQFPTGKRCFAFTFNSTLNTIELHEILLDVQGHFDDDHTRITMQAESAALFKNVNPPAGAPKTLLRLLDGEIQVDQVVGSCHCKIDYKPDQYPCWVPWVEFDICTTQATTGQPNLKPGYFPRVGFGEPDGRLCDSFSERPFREGYNFQLRLTVTGSLRVIAVRLASVEVPEIAFAPPVCDATCGEIDCTDTGA